MTSGKGHHKRTKIEPSQKTANSLHYARSSCSQGKLSFPTRADAKAFNAYTRRRGGDNMSPYYHDECMTYHLGHLPKTVRDGYIGREDYYGRA